jgi:alanine dehydrogenase
MLHPDQVLFTYLHLAADPQQTAALRRSGCIAIAYETITDAAGRLPLLAPMSEVAGRMAVQAGARCLEQCMGGSGILLSGVPGVEPAKVVILGAGVAGSHALAMAVGLGAEVTVIDRDLARLKALDSHYARRVRTVFSTKDAIERHVVAADLVIGTVLVPGAAAPKLITREMVATMRPGAVIVDVAVDQGGCCATTRPTTHTTPTFLESGVVHYCVANMPGGVARTSTFALNNATLPYALALANKGVDQAVLDDPGLLAGVNTYRGAITCPPVAESQDRPYRPFVELLDD